MKFDDVDVTISSDGETSVVGASTLGFDSPALLGDSLPLGDAAWRTLTIRYALFFFVTAGINEVVRRYVEWDTYVTFKVFGMMGLTLIFTITQAPFLNRELQSAQGESR